MVLRALRLILGVVLVIVAAVLITNATKMLTGESLDLRGLILPAMMIAGAVLGLWAYYYAMFRQSDPFKAVRAIIACVVTMIILIMLSGTGVEAYEVLSADTVKLAELTMPIVRVVGAAAIFMGFYFAMVAHTGLRRTLENIFSIPELLKKLAFTLGLLCIYRIGFQIPLPGLNQEALARTMSQAAEGPLGQAMEYFAMFTGGSLQRLTLFGLGIMPYISASIIFQLLTAVVPALEKLQKEGPAGYRKIQEYTRYATVALCLVQAALVWKGIMGQHIYPSYSGDIHVFLMGVVGMTCGTVFLMWLGEQIDEYGIGNGISLIIMAGIVSRMPLAIRELVEQASLKVTAGAGQIGLIKIIFMIAAFVFVVAGAILICQAQRRIPIQQAKHTRGRRVYGGQRQYLPLRVNHGGVMPIIFASSLLLLPNALTKYLADLWPSSAVAAFFAQAFDYGNLIHQLVYVGLIFFFAYFWTTVQFRPRDMSDQLRDYGNFIPGLRPGRRTAEYLERVMERITYCGAAFLAAIAVTPQALAGYMGIPTRISSFLGGTGLLIMVSVGLDLVQRIESNLIMRNYGGLLGGGGRIRGTR